MVALFTLMNTLLLICLSLKSWRTFFTLTDRKLFYYYLRDRKLFYVRFFVTIWFQVRFLLTVDIVFCPVTSIQGVPGLVTLLILVLLGKLLVTLDDVGALGFVSSLYSEKLKDIFTKPFSSWILPWTSQPSWLSGRGSFPATSSSSGSSPALPAVCLPQPPWLLKIIQMT